MKVLVCAEARQNQLDRLFYELVTAARSVAEAGEVVALWIGADDEAPRGQMGSADRVLAATDPRFVSATADIYATALHRAIEAEKPDLTIIGYTAAGMDFGPEAATRARLPMAANVVALERNAEWRIDPFADLWRQDDRSPPSIRARPGHGQPGRLR